MTTWGEPNKCPAQHGDFSLYFSGTGYRAVMFHLGVLWRIAELGLLANLKSVHSASAGSIVGAALGCHWHLLRNGGVHSKDDFRKHVVAPLLRLSFKWWDPSYPFATRFGGWARPHQRLPWSGAVGSDKTLKCLPDRTSGGPELFFGATNVETGVRWKFSRRRMGCLSLGWRDTPIVALDAVIQAAIATPYRPFELDRTADIHRWRMPQGDNQQPRHRLFLCDYSGTDYPMPDELSGNLPVLVSDAGALVGSVSTPVRRKPDEAQAYNLMLRSAYELRRDTLARAFRRGRLGGVYLDIASDPRDLSGDDVLECPFAVTRKLAEIPSEWIALDEFSQYGLIDWGYALCDAGIKKTHICTNRTPPDFAPYRSFYRRYSSRQKTAAA